MSSGHQQHFTSADIDMLDRVLARAGICDHADLAGKDRRLSAARFLIEKFQHGMIDESALYFVLQNRPGDLPDPIPSPPAVAQSLKSSAPAKQHPTSNTKGGYRFGRRVEHDGTWTIYHVFSGEPVRYGSWNMVGLNIRAAERALKLLNAPLAPA